jgi:hypothetical protein
VTTPAPDPGARIAEELHREFADSVPVPIVRACVAAAIADRRGSISAEALPEMAVRLARVRLASQADGARHGDFRPVAQGRSAPRQSVG